MVSEFFSTTPKTEVATLPKQECCCQHLELNTTETEVLNGLFLLFISSKTGELSRFTMTVRKKTGGSMQFYSPKTCDSKYQDHSAKIAAANNINSLDCEICGLDQKDTSGRDYNW
jgi:hypothetical protein